MAEFDSQAPAVVDQTPVALVFSSMVSALSQAMAANQHNNAVDVQLTFQSVTTDAHGVPLFTKHSTQSQMQIQLATRITPK